MVVLRLRAGFSARVRHFSAYMCTNSAEEGSEDSEIMTRVEGVEEELRNLVEDKRERDAEIHDQVNHALSIAQRIGTGCFLCLPRYTLSFCYSPLALDLAFNHHVLFVLLSLSPLS